MNYPHWEVPGLGGGMVIALIATLHVLIAHFSVGAGLFVAVTESKLARRPNALLADFLYRFGKFIILFSFVAGALTGVGIWFSIGLVSPRATSIIIHTYVWGWAAEWACFLVEIAAGYVYFYGFGRLPDAQRRAVAWIYAWASWGSLFIVNGIISYMLTPGKWLATGNFWDGFFNPTFWPSLVLRSISAAALAGIFVAIVANGARAYGREQAREIINHAAWFLAPLVLMLPCGYWYFMMMPPPAIALLKGGAMVMTMFFFIGMAASTLVGVYAFVGLIWNKRYVNMETAILLGAIAFMATVAMEFVREGVRKPWLIYGVIYSNGWTPNEQAALNRDGVLAHSPWMRLDGATQATLAPVELGRRVFQIECSPCHVVDGVNDIKPLIWSWDRDLLEKNLPRIHLLKPFMPPLVGTPQERKALIDYLMSLNNRRAKAGYPSPTPAPQVLPGDPVTSVTREAAR